MVTKDLGMVTAYAYAVEGGYTGTEAEFEALLGNIAIDLAEIENLSVVCTSLPAGSDPTASYSNGVLTLGIPVPNGIASIEETSTSGAVHTYTITLDDGDTSTFDVTDGEVTQAVLDAAVSDLKADLNGKKILPFAGASIIQGTYNSGGAYVASDARIRVSGFVEVHKGEQLTFKAGTNTTQMEVGIFNSSKVYQGASFYLDGTVIDITDDCYFIIAFRKDSEDSDIIPSEYDAVTTIIPCWKVATNELYEDFDSLLGKVTQSQNITDIDGVTKLAGYSFGTSSNFVSGSVNASYDSYYFYTDKDTAMYFESVAPSAPTYIALTVGYSPFKAWKTDSVGTMQMACTSAIRKRKSENNLPISSAPLDVSNAIVIITVTKNTTTAFYINNKPILDSNILLNNSQINQVINNIPRAKAPQLQYKATSEWADEHSSEQIDIYIPTVYGYVRYAFGHSIDNDIKANSWRIFRALSTDDTLTDRFSITTHGEWEMALKINEGTDFIGGILHGDEVLDSVHFFVDGKEVTISSLTALTEFKELRIVETTNLYNPDEQTENIAVHNKEYIFTEDGLRLNQRVLWLMAKTMTTSYCCMFPIIRGNDSVSELQITSDYYDNNDYQIYDVSVGGQSGYPFTWHSNVTKAHLYSDESGVFASAEMIKQPSLAGGNMSFLQNTVNQYNKLYYSICGIGTTYNTSVNERWDITTEYKISVADNA